jgi:hypothetical protein
LVIDATGVGASLASFLDKALPGRVVAFTFNAATKSRLGWEWLAVVETGRWKEWVEEGNKATSNKATREEDTKKGGRGDKGRGNAEKEEFFEELRHCQMEIVPGPERRMKWGVPDGTRSASTGKLVHDDWIMSAALCAELDKWEWAVSSPAVVIKRRDPIVEMDKEGF